MLTILQCTDSFLPVTDGVGRTVFEYASALANRGNAVYVATPQKDMGYRGAYPFEIVDYREVSLIGPRAFKSGVAYLDSHYRKHINGIPLSIVHAHTPGSSGLEACRLAQKRSIPLIGTFHPIYFDDVSRYVHNKGLSRAAVRYVAEFYTRCDEVWTITKQAADMLSNAGFGGHIEIIRTGTELHAVPDEDLMLVRHRYHLSADPLLLHVGAIDFHKNVERILEAAERLHASGVAFQLLFAGKGPDERRARALVKEKGLSGTVRFLGTIEDDRLLYALYRAADLVLYPAHSITAGLVVSEAASAGTPSVVMKGSASAEAITDGYNGLLSDDDADMLSRVIARQIFNRDALAAMGEHARKSIPVPWNEVMDRVLERYERLTDRGRFQLKRKLGPFRTEMSAMNETLQMRSIDLIGRFLNQDMQNVYAYKNTQLHTRNHLPVRRSVSLPRSTPEEMGVSGSKLQTLIREMDADPAGHVHALMALRHGRVIASCAWSPYDSAHTRQLYSLSKSVTGMAIGMLVDDGLLDLDERLVDIFPDKAPADRKHPVYGMMVRHLLEMSTGSEFNETGSPLGADWVREFMNAGTWFLPGTQFLYNSMNTYMLSAIVHRKTGMTMTAFLKERLYEPLGIYSYEWEKCPMGIEKGGWGLMLTIEDVAKLGQLYLNGGVWTIDGMEKRILSRRWVEESTKKQIDTPDGEMKSGYGYQVWISDYPGAYIFNGAFGQYMIALPDRDAVVVVLSGTSRLFAQGNVMALVAEAFSDAADGPMPEDPASLAALNETAERLSAMHRAPFFDPDRAEAPLAAFSEALCGRVYTFQQNIAGVFPVILQSVHNNYAGGLRHIVLKKSDDGRLAVVFDEAGGENEIPLSPGEFTFASVGVHGETHPVAASAQVESLDTGEWILNINLFFLDTPFTRRIRLYFKADAVTAVFDESPTVKDASVMLLELAGVTKIQMVRRLMSVLEKDMLQTRLQTYTTTTAQGRL